MVARDPISGVRGVYDSKGAYFLEKNAIGIAIGPSIWNKRRLG